MAHTFWPLMLNCISCFFIVWLCHWSRFSQNVTYSNLRVHLKFEISSLIANSFAYIYLCLQQFIFERSGLKFSKWPFCLILMNMAFIHWEPLRRSWKKNPKYIFLWILQLKNIYNFYFLFVGSFSYILHDFWYSWWLKYEVALSPFFYSLNGRWK